MWTHFFVSSLLSHFFLSLLFLSLFFSSFFLNLKIARAVMHSAALSIFRRLGASIEEQGGDAYKSKSLKMETIKTIVKQFMTDGKCVCLYFFITC